MASEENSTSNVLTPLCKKPYEEVVTPHNITLLIFIRAFYNVSTGTSPSEIMNFPLKSRRGFALVIEHLLSCPDLNFSEFEDTIRDSKYDIPEEVLKHFGFKINSLIRGDIETFVDYINESFDTLSESKPQLASPIVGRSSPVGTFLRKIIIFVDKLSFCQTVKVYRLMQHYYAMSKGLDMDQYKMDICDDQSGMEISITCPQTPFPNLLVSLFDNDENAPKLSTEEKFAEFTSWSRKQMELFLVNQGALLTYDEDSALPPLVLERQMEEIIKVNPEYAESYYIAYLNCLRMYDYVGAQEYLHKYFDSESSAFKGEDRSRSYRFAALNLAILHTHFENKKAALFALREAITLSHLAGDTCCLYMAHAWYRYLNNTDEVSEIETVTAKCEEIEVFPVCSVGLQSYARSLIMNGQNTDAAFQLLQRSDMMNSQNLLHDIILIGFSNKAGIWDMFGKHTMTFSLSQVLLLIDATSAIWNLKRYNTESVSIAICNCVAALLNEGNYDLARIPLNYAKERFPNRYSEIWKFVEQIYKFEFSINTEQWNNAYKAASDIAAIDKHESLFRYAQLCFAKGDKVGTHDYINQILKDKPNLSVTMKLRAYILLAQIGRSSTLIWLTKALGIASHYKFYYFIAIIKFEIAKFQFLTGFVTEALSMLKQCKVMIFSEKRFADQAAYLILNTRCKIASVADLDSTKRVREIEKGIAKLNVAKSMYKKLKCHSKVKEVSYLQCFGILFIVNGYRSSWLPMELINVPESEILNEIIFVAGLSCLVLAILQFIILFYKSYNPSLIYGMVLYMMFCFWAQLVILEMLYKGRDPYNSYVKSSFSRWLTDYNTDQDAQILVDTIQREFECCGIDGAGDWLHIERPRSCCAEIPSDKICYTWEAYSTGCHKVLLEKTKFFMDKNNGYIMAVLYIEAVFMILTCYEIGSRFIF